MRSTRRIHRRPEGRDRCHTIPPPSRPDIHVPHLVDAEVINALRRKLLSGQLDALALRGQLSAYDAI